MTVPPARRWLVGRFYLVLAALASALMAAEYLTQRVKLRRFAEDFEFTFWKPWHAIREGVSPYPDPGALHVDGNPFLYPPAAGELTLPLSWLPFPAAAAIFAIALLGSAALTLWALDVRQPTLWAIWMLSAPVIGATAIGNATLLVILALALTWRWRDRPVLAASALTAGLVLKLFVWPVWLWLLFTRRLRAAAYSALAVASLAFASWAVIDFRGLTDYPSLLAAMSEARGSYGLLVYALAVKFTSDTVAFAVALATAATLLTASFYRSDDDRASLTLALLAALVATPILWLHYLGLMVIPAAFYGGLLWGVVPLLWLIRLAPYGIRPTWLVLAFTAMVTIVAVRALQGQSERSTPAGGTPRWQCGRERARSS